MSKSPAYQWYVSDYRSDENVMLMNYEQQGVYRFLLDHQWLHGSIPNNPSLLSGLLKIDEKHFSEQIWGAIAPCFVESNNRLLNLRMERDRQIKDEFLAKQAENGRRGGRPKQVQKEKEKPKQKPNKSGGLILANPNESSSSSSSSSNIPPISPKGELELPSELEDLRDTISDWLIYRKQRKQPFTPLSFSRLIKACLKEGVPRSREVIEASIENGWQGIFWDKIPDSKDSAKEKRERMLGLI